MEEHNEHSLIFLLLCLLLFVCEPVAICLSTKNALILISPNYFRREDNRHKNNTFKQRKQSTTKYYLLAIISITYHFRGACVDSFAGMS